MKKTIEQKLVQQFEEELNKETEQKYSVPVYKTTYNIKEIKQGILQKIKTAQSESEINQLLAEGCNYKNLQQKTKTKWNRFALIRKNQLKNK